MFARFQTAWIVAATAWSLALCSSGRAQSYQGSVLYPLATPYGFYDDLLDSLFGHQLHAAPGQVVGFSRTWGDAFHALMWDQSGNVIDLQPTGLSGFLQSKGFGGSATHQFGSAWNPFIGSEQAVVWSGTAASAVNWHPTNISITHSRMASSDGGQYVGSFGTAFGSERAALWNGSSAAAVNLHPTSLGYVDQSRALAVHSGRQGGGGLTTTGAEHAMLWSGTANSAVDLHPTMLPEVQNSTIFGMHGDQQVGIGETLDYNARALLWTGTAKSAINLHPTQLSLYAQTRAVATNGSIQVGGALTLSEIQHAMAWSGSASSAVVLHSLLPSGFYMSGATSVDAQGVIYGLAVNESDVIHAVRWTPIASGLPGDFNNDGSVNHLDLPSWRNSFGMASGATVAQGDADNDGDVDGADFLAWQRNLSGAGALPVAGSVPEPRGCALGFAVALAPLIRRRRD